MRFAWMLTLLLAGCVAEGKIFVHNTHHAPLDTVESGVEWTFR